MSIQGANTPGIEANSLTLDEEAFLKLFPRVDQYIGELVSNKPKDTGSTVSSKTPPFPQIVQSLLDNQKDQPIQVPGDTLNQMAKQYEFTLSPPQASTTMSLTEARQLKAKGVALPSNLIVKPTRKEQLLDIMSRVGGITPETTINDNENPILGFATPIGQFRIFYHPTGAIQISFDYGTKCDKFSVIHSIADINDLLTFLVKLRMFTKNLNYIRNDSDKFRVTFRYYTTLIEQYESKKDIFADLIGIYQGSMNALMICMTQLRQVERGKSPIGEILSSIESSSMDSRSVRKKFGSLFSSIFYPTTLGDTTLQNTTNDRREKMLAEQKNFLFSLARAFKTLKDYNNQLFMNYHLDPLWDEVMIYIDGLQSKSAIVH